MPLPENHKPSTTKWTNPTPHPMKVPLWTPDNRKVVYEWTPGETLELPSEFDEAIHTTRDGVIVGGLAPLLVKVGSAETLDPVLDPAAAAKKASDEATVKAMDLVANAKSVIEDSESRGHKRR